jgi:hypothetical protein
MKKIIFSIAFVMCDTVAIYAQSINKSVPLKQEEVPVTVVNALQKDFASIAGELSKGSWSVMTQQTNGQPIKPLFYIYKAKKGDSKFEARYSPTGELESSKGATKDPNSGS